MQLRATRFCQSNVCGFGHILKLHTAQWNTRAYFYQMGSLQWAWRTSKLLYTCRKLYKVSIRYSLLLLTFTIGRQKRKITKPSLRVVNSSFAWNRHWYFQIGSVTGRRQDAEAFKSQLEAMATAEKRMLIYSAVMRQTRNAHGDFAKRPLKLSLTNPKAVKRKYYNAQKGFLGRNLNAHAWKGVANRQRLIERFKLT